MIKEQKDQIKVVWNSQMLKCSMKKMMCSKMMEMNGMKIEMMMWINKNNYKKRKEKGVRYIILYDKIYYYYILYINIYARDKFMRDFVINILYQ